jgi:hypothetical protein
MTDDRLARYRPIGHPVMSDHESIASNFRVREPSISSFENVPSGVRTLAVAEYTAGVYYGQEIDTQPFALRHWSE